MKLRLALLAVTVLATIVCITGEVISHSVNGLTDERVFLPCRIDVASCGNFHSVKWYRDSQRVFVFSELVHLQRSEGPLANRATFVPVTNGSAESGLNIESLRLLDEGLYRCEVTYLEIIDGCPIVQYVQLTVNAAPEYVELLLEDGRTSAAIRNVSRIGPFNEGTTVTLLCRSGGGKPVPQLTWWNGTQPLGGNFVSTAEESTGTVTGINRLQIALSRNDLGALWYCKVDSPALKTPMKADLKIDVHVRPLSITLTGIEGAVVEGTAVVVYCVVEGARPAATISWYNNTSPLQKAVVENTQLQDDGTFVTRSRLIYTVTRHDNGQILSCQAANTVTEDLAEEPEKISHKLQVLYAPSVFVSPENVSVNESMDVLLFCSFDANPITLTTVQWFKDGEELDVQREKYEGATVDQPALLIKNASRQDTGAYACKVGNSVGTVQSENVAFISVQYKPEVRLVMEPETPVNERLRPNITLHCEIVNGNPPVLLGVRWYLDGELLKELPDCPINDSYSFTGYNEDLCDVDPSKLLLEYVGRSFQGNYSCEAMNAAGWGPLSDEEELLIYYPPENTSLTYDTSIVVKDGQLVLSCGAGDLGQPPVNQYKWTRNGQVIGQVTTANWTIFPVTLESSGNYTCTPVNEAGEGDAADAYVDVLSSPMFIESLPQFSSALFNATETSLTCRVECYPLCEVHWFKNSIPLQGSSLYSVRNRVIAKDPKINYHESILSTLVFNTKSWNTDRLESWRDGVNYTCFATANSVGDEISSSTIFKIEYPPESVVISPQAVDVEEGSSNALLQCSSSSYPEASYYWYYNNQVISSSPRLQFSTGITRDKAGEYTCVAKNQHGSSSTKAYVNVLYKPECSVTLREDRGKTQLVCEVRSNPAFVDFTWISNNSSVTKDVIHMGLQSILTLENNGQPLGVYYCYANNSLGMSTPCEINVAGTAGLLAKLGDENMIIIIAVIAAAMVMILIVCVVLAVICRRKRAEDKFNKSSPSQRENPDGLSNLTLSSTTQVQPVHKWPLKPGVLVHLNGLNSMTLSSSGTLPFTSTVLRAAGSGTDSGSESTRSVVRVGPVRKSQRSKDCQSQADPVYQVVQHKDESFSSTLNHPAGSKDNTSAALDNGTVSRKRKKPGTAVAANATKPGETPCEVAPKTFYENVPYHGPTKTPTSKESPSRPGSQMSQAASSGYGSARSQGTSNRNRGLGSLRQSKPGTDVSSQFRSLRIPRNGADSTSSLPVTDTDTLQLHSLPEKHEVPVPAPRFQTLKRHAYQNIPLPVKNKIQDPVMTPPGTSATDEGSAAPSAYSRVYDSPNVPVAQYAGQRTPIVYADLSIARPTTTTAATATAGKAAELSPTEYAILEFMGGGTEVQV